MNNYRISNYYVFFFFLLIFINTSIADDKLKDNSSKEDKKAVVIKAHESALQHNKSGKTKRAISELEKVIETARSCEDEKLLEKTYEYLILFHKKIGSDKKAAEYQYLLHLIQTSIEKNELEGKFKNNELKISNLEEKHLTTELEKQKAEDELNKKTLALLQTKDSLEILDTLNKDRLAQIGLLQKEKEIEALILKEKDTQLKHQELVIKEKEARQKYISIIITALVFGIMVLSVLAYFIYKNLTQKKRYSNQIEQQLELIQHQHESITNSINYASKIQNSMLPTERTFQNIFKDSFILFKPKDIVSGDFYWFFNVSTGDTFNEYIVDKKSLDISTTFEKIIVVAADCTGHGVPGALMSMIGYNLLDVIAHKKIHEPDKILEELNRGIRFALQQHTNNNQDGMDLALCVIDLKENIIEFAGAKNPMIIIQDGELQHFKGDKHPIGGSQGETKRTYTKQIVPLKKDTFVYLFSDGYADQFGGPENRKFMIKNLKDLLLDNHTKPFKEQKEILNQTIENWKGNKEKQIDDILVMGMKVS